MGEGRKGHSGSPVETMTSDWMGSIHSGMWGGSLVPRSTASNLWIKPLPGSSVVPDKSTVSIETHSAVIQKDVI